MNALARVVHDLVTSGDSASLESLSEVERIAVAEARSLLHVSPKELAALMAEGPAPEDWAAAPAVASQAS